MHFCHLHLTVPGLAASLLLVAAGSLHGQNVVRLDNRSLFQMMAPQATNTINFERNLGAAVGTGSLGTFTEAGFVTFNSGSNYTQQVIDGFNVGQGNNDVYVSQAFNKQFATANITFATGVLSLGFDFKNTSNGPTSPPTTQSFTFNLFSGAASLGSFASTTLIDGSTFQFLGFTSDTPITAMTIVATVPGLSPNLDIILDNFAVASPVPEPATVGLLGAGLLALVVTRARGGSRRG